MPVKINQKKKKTVIDLQSQIDHINDLSDESVNDQQQSDHSSETTPTVQTDIQQPSPSAQQGNVDLWSFLAQMTQMMWQQNEMMKMMDERMKKLEENQKPAVEGEVVKEPEVVVPLNEDNVASYNRETEEGYAEVINKVWKIMYITEQAPMTKWMPDAAPMMATVEERRRVWNIVVSDTKYFNSEAEAKAYIENVRKKGITLPWARIISCYI